MSKAEFGGFLFNNGGVQVKDNGFGCNGARRAGVRVRYPLVRLWLTMKLTVNGSSDSQRVIEHPFSTSPDGIKKVLRA